MVETLGEKATWVLHKNARCHFEQFLEAASHKTAAEWLFASYATDH